MKQKRLHIFAIVIAGWAFLIGPGCSSDPDTPLGTGFGVDSLIVSRPGEVFQDTAVIAAGDTSFGVNANSLAQTTTLTLGQKDNYEKWPVLRFDFSSAPSTSVLSAELVLLYVNDQDTTKLDAQFFNPVDTYSESDTFITLPLGSVIPDDVGNPDRVISSAGLQSYLLPPALVQDWISGAQTHTGIAVKLTDTTTDEEVILGSRENGTYNPRLKVVFADGTLNFAPSDDGTYVKAVSPTANLVISDGLVRRIWLPVPLDSVDPTTLVHDASLELALVPGANVGSGFTVTVYAPSSSDFSDPGILKGTLVTAVIVDPDSSTVRLRIRRIVDNFITGKTENNGLVLQYTEEGTAIRQLEFYSGTAAADLRPRIAFIISDVPSFP